jgi:hypothetical protein
MEAHSWSTWYTYIRFNLAVFSSFSADCEVSKIHIVKSYSQGAMIPIVRVPGTEGPYVGQAIDAGEAQLIFRC